MVANGGKQVIFDALMATVDDGDEVVIPAPYWGAYPLTTKLVGGTPVIVNCPQNNGFKLRPEDLDAAITPKTKWLVLNLPNNPTGAACNRAELQAIADVMLQAPACLDHVRRHVRTPGLWRLRIRHHRRCRAEAARADADHHRRIENLRHDRLAHRLRCRDRSR